MWTFFEVLFIVAFLAPVIMDVIVLADKWLRN